MCVNANTHTHAFNLYSDSMYMTNLAQTEREMVLLKNYEWQTCLHYIVAVSACGKKALNHIVLNEKEKHLSYLTVIIMIHEPQQAMQLRL